MIKLKYIFIVILILCHFSCAPGVSFIKYTDAKYSPTTSIQVFRKSTIERKFIELGELSVRILNDSFSNNEEKAFVSIKEKAEEIGADAIIIIGTEKITVFKNDEQRYLKAVAIKYIQ